MSTDPSPCLDCGACCAFFRCSFHWSETDAYPGGRVPAELTTPITPHLVAMLGTQGKSPRCTALEGEIGGPVRCRIYANRPTPCREFEMDGAGGQGNHRCREARLAWGLPPLESPACSPDPEDGETPPDAPRNPPIAA